MRRTIDIPRTRAPRCCNLRGQSQRDGVVKVGIMELQIVWRNPHPPGTRKLMVKRIVADAYGGLYEVRSAHEIKVFELLESRAA